MNISDIIEKIPELELSIKPTRDIYVQIKNDNYINIYTGEEMSYREIPKKDGIRANIISRQYSKDSTSQSLDGIYYQYVPEIECLAVMKCFLDIRILDRSIHKWKIVDKFFITKDKELITQYNDKWIVINENIVSAVPFSLYINSIDTPYNFFEDANDNLLKESEYIFPAIYLQTSKVTKLRYTSTLVEFLKKKEVVKKGGPKQQKIDELIQIPLEELNAKEFEQYELNSYRRNTIKVVKISPVKSGVCCLRYISKTSFSAELLENVRIYVDNKTFIACKKNNKGEYVQLKTNAGKDNFAATNILEFDHKILDDTILQYFGSIFDELPTEIQATAIWSFLQYPIFERLYKLDYKILVKKCLSSWEASPIEALNRSFGKVKPKEKTIYKALGINKHQFERLKEMLGKTETGTSIIKNIKEILVDGESIDAIDNNTFDILFDCYKEPMLAGAYTYGVNNVLKHIRTLYSTKMVLKLCNDVFKLNHDNNIAFRRYDDYLLMVSKIDGAKHFKPNFTDSASIHEMHDAVQVIYNLKKETYKLDAFNAQAGKWTNFVYKGKEFSVIAPTHPSEIAREGIELHHCVKSYIDRVSNGITNIVFIRKNGQLDTPFFTVEISNNGVIEQVHGFSNRMANTEPKLEDFIDEWAKNKKLKLSNINKIR